MNILLIVWLAFFGAVIGSFLNVVVYRLPLGKSVVSPPSHCPKCSHRIRWFDNVPVFGWLMLGGKCRDCKAPISVRYPLVEFFCGLVFGLLGFLTLERFPDGDAQNLLALAGIQSVLIVSLFAIGLIEFDQKPIPWTVLIPSLILAPFAMYLASDISGKDNPVSGFTSGLIIGGTMLLSFLHLGTRWANNQRALDYLWAGTIFCLFVLYFVYLIPAIAAAPLLIILLPGCLNRPMRCRFLVLSFVTFGVLCAALTC